MPPRILIAEDHETARDLVRRALENEGFELRYAQTGGRALEEIAAEPFDVIFLDVSLPEVSGLDVCRRVKENPATASVPVLLTSGALGTRELAEESRRAGADACIPKPFSLSELRTVIRAFVRIRQQAQEIEELRARVRELSSSLGPGPPDLDWSLPYHDFMRIVRKRYFEHALAEAGGNKSRMARRSGVDRSTLYVHFRNLGLLQPRKPPSSPGASRRAEAAKRSRPPAASREEP
jgi:CheY-like chemotaxis protein